MSYVDAVYLREKNEIRVVERVNGQRVEKSMAAEHVLYFAHPAGTHKSIYGDPCKKYATTDREKFYGELKKHRAKGTKLFETDINPVFRALATHYAGAEPPALNIGYFDIEAAWDSERGFAPTDDPFNPITAITVHLGHEKRSITLALKPASYSVEEAQEIAAKTSDTFVFESEEEMLETFLGVIEDVDVLTGWNSEGYDIPYLVNRVERILGKGAAKAMCLWGLAPRKREYEKFKRKYTTYDLVGRVHLDYLLLYQKHNTQQLHSYRLDYVGEIEVNENKVPYEGTLDELYNRDFEKFIAYNRQDVELLAKIDAKRKFIELSNQVAHANCVLLKTTMGSVALVETAIINEMRAMGFVVPDRKPRTDGKKIEPDDEPDERPANFDDDEAEDDGRTPVVGAYVAKPKVGLQREIGCVDVNSLYPHVIMALNMSPETIVGQIRPTETMALVAKRIDEGWDRAEAWDGIFMLLECEHMHARDANATITVDFESGDSRVFTGAKLHDHIFNPKNNLCISANGTIIATDRKGMIPDLLAKWYADRKAMQKKAKDFKHQANEASDETAKKEALFWHEYWDKRQYARKILLNSLYGALLNESMRFYDERLGQSVTMTGRCVVRHMGAKINEVICGEYDYLGNAVLYQDTDSVAFDSVIQTNHGDMTIERLFHAASIKWCSGDKEYATDDRIAVLGYDHASRSANYESVNYVYRHKVRKKKYRITDCDGRSVVVTEDHSIMVLRDGVLVEVKPADIKVGDNVVTSGAKYVYTDAGVNNVRDRKNH